MMIFTATAICHTSELEMCIWLVDLELNGDFEEHLVTRAPGILAEIIEERKRLEIQKEEFGKE